MHVSQNKCKMQECLKLVLSYRFPIQLFKIRMIFHIKAFQAYYLYTCNEINQA